ncbi:MAG TPA: T9SS type A sorting domain-containing protein [Chitinophagaceae bacterium]
MKKIILSIITLCLINFGFGQLKVETGANWLITGNASIVLQDMDLVNDGLINGGMGSFRFIGFQNSTISGNSTSLFYIMEMAKTNSAKVTLNRNINISYSVNFVSGQIELNGNNIFLASAAFLSGESELNRVTGVNGGYVQIIQILYTPNMANPGNLGAFITNATDLGPVTIRRGYTAKNGTGLPTSINRYYEIIPTNNTGLNATLRLKYFDAELNGQTEAGLVIYQSNDGGANWSNLSRTSNSTSANYVEKTTISSFGLQTLANDVQTTSGVTGPVFTGQRKKATEVTLKWTSQTETNMSRYQVQRKLDTELDFSDRASVNTLAPGGNSLSPLNYQNIDANAHTGNSYYRLKIITIDNTFTYSDVITVAGKTKGVKGGGNHNFTLLDEEEPSTARVMNNSSVASKKITVGPNPNNGNFWFSINGIEKETIATLYTIDGKQINQFRVVNLQQQHVNNLRSGIYLLKVAGLETQKIIVNGGRNGGQQSKQIITDNIKL